MNSIERYLRRRRYFAAARAASQALDCVAAAPNPVVRYSALCDLASWMEIMAIWVDDDQDPTVDALLTAAQVAGMIADTELSVSLRLPHRPDPANPLAGGPQIAPMLERLGTTHRPGARAVLVLELHRRLTRDIGAGPAEVLCSIAAAYYRLHGLPRHLAARLARSRVAHNADSGDAA